MIKLLILDLFADIALTGEIKKFALTSSLRYFLIWVLSCWFCRTSNLMTQQPHLFDLLTLF